MQDGYFAYYIPGLFLTCVQHLNLVKLGRNFEADFGSRLLQLRAIELRLQRWGEAAGIKDEDSADFVRRLKEQHTEDEIEFAYYACEQIELQLTRAQEDSTNIIKMSRNREELDFLDEDEQLAVAGQEKPRAAARALDTLRSGYLKGTRFTDKLRIQLLWTLYKTTQLDSLVSAIGEHVTVLETIFPVQSKALAAKEAESMDTDVIETLVPLAEANEPLLARALLEVGSRRGMLFENITADDHAKYHLGNQYSDVPPNKGQTIYRGLVLKGNSVGQAGHIYGKRE